MRYIRNLLIAIDQLGNAIADGNPDNTISGRIGKFARFSTGLVSYYWRALQFIVDVTFYPIDGWRHCYQAYQAELTEEYYAAKKVAVAVLALITVLSCMVLIIPFYIILLIRVLRHGRRTD